MPQGLEEFQLSVSLKREVLTDVLPSLQRPGTAAVPPTLLLPLVAFARLLEVAAQSTQAGVVEGFVMDELAHYRVNALEGWVEQRRPGEAVPERRPLPPAEVLVVNGEVYLSVQQIEALFPLRLSYELRRQALLVQALAPLPLIERRAREQARLRRAASPPSSATAIEALADFPYRAWRPPSGDLQFHAGASDSERIRWTANGLLAGELAHASATLAFSARSGQGWSDARLAFGRDDPYGRALGSLGATQWRVGDIQAPQGGLAGTWATGRGAWVSNASLEAPTEFDRTRIDGDAPAGWEVELYRGRELMGVQPVGSDGRYTFDDVALNPGPNEFRVVIHGPAGQRREERRPVDVAARLLPPGRVEYRVALGQPGTRLLGFALPRHTPVHGGAPWAASAELAWGLSRSLSARVFTSRTPESTRVDAPFSRYAGADLTAGLGPSIWQVEWVQQFGGSAQHHQAWRVAGLLPIGPAGLSWRHSRFATDFRSTASTDLSRPIRRDSSVWFSLPLPDGVSLGTTARRRVLHTRRVEDEWGPYLRHPLGGLFVDHQFLGLRHRAGNVTVLRERAWLPSASYWNGTWSGRMSAMVRLTPERQLERLQASAQWRWAPASVLSAAVSRLTGSGEHHLALGASREWQRVVLTLSANLSNRGERSLGLALATSFGFDADGRPTLSAQRLASAGRADVRVWAADDDAEDGSGRRAVPQAGVLVDGGRYRPTDGDESGRVLLSGLPVTRAVRLRLDEGSLDDPFLMASDAEHVFLPRPGVTHTIDFMLVPSLEIAGTVTGQLPAGPKPLPGLRVELLDAEGRIAGVQRTQYDGFYLFHRLPPGVYRLRVPAGQQVRTGDPKAPRLTLAAERPVPAPAAGESQVDAVDLRVDLAPH